MQKLCSNEKCVLYNDKKRNSCAGIFRDCKDSDPDQRYADIDEKMKHLADKKKIACVYGFKYVSEMMFVLYTDVGFTPSKIADLLEVTGPNVRYQLERMNYKAKNKGGRRAGNGILGLTGIYPTGCGTYVAWYHKDYQAIYLKAHKTLFMACWARRCAEIKYGYEYKSTAQAYINKNWRDNRGV